MNSVNVEHDSHSCIDLIADSWHIQSRGREKWVEKRLLFYLFVLILIIVVLSFSHSSMAGGLTTDGARMWAQGYNDVGGSSQDFDQFGSVMASGDFNGDDYPDLVVGIPYEDNNYFDDGALTIIYGTPSGLNATSPNDTFLYHEDLASPLGSDVFFGAAFAVGDFDGDNFDDLAIGCPGTEVNGNAGAGEVIIVYGAASGLDTSRHISLNQDTPGVEGDAEAGDQFGSSLTSGDYNGDNVDDLIVGVHGEDIGIISDAGLIQIFWGSQVHGLTVTGNYYIHADSSGIEGNSEVDDRFGAVLTTGGKTTCGGTGLSHKKDYYRRFQ